MATVSVSFADIVADWCYYNEVATISDPSIEIQARFDLAICIISTLVGIFTVITVLSQGCIAGSMEIPSSISCFMRNIDYILGLEVLLEDVPQLAITLIIELKRGEMSPFAVFNVTTSGFNMLFNIIDMMYPSIDEDEEDEEDEEQVLVEESQSAGALISAKDPSGKVPLTEA